MRKEKPKSFYITKEDAALIAANMQKFKGKSQDLFDECMAKEITKQFPYTKIGA